MSGKQLRIARKKANMTLQQVAMRMNTTHATISRYENDRRKIDPDTMKAFCELYNVSADFILGLPKGLPYPDETEL